MKKILLSLLISSISLTILAQKRSHATLELLFEHPLSIYENTVIQIFFNNKPAATVKIKEKLVFTIYSEGRITLAFVDNYRAPLIIDFSKCYFYLIFLP